MPLWFYTLMASIAYSTWKIRPSGENVLTPLLINKSINDYTKFYTKFYRVTIKIKIN